MHALFCRNRIFAKKCGALRQMDPQIWHGQGNSRTDGAEPMRGKKAVQEDNQGQEVKNSG